MAMSRWILLVVSLMSFALYSESCKTVPQSSTASAKTLRFKDDSLSKARANRELFTLASVRYTLRDYISAIRQLRAMKLDDENGAVELLLAKCFQSLVRIDSAEYHVRKAVTLLEQEDEPLLILAQLLVSTHRFDEAAEAYEQALKRTPRASTQFALAQTYELIDDPRSISILKELVERTEDLTALFELAGVYEKRGMSAEYVQCMERIMTDFPAQSLPFQDYFESLLDTRNYSQALSVLETRNDFSQEIRREQRMRLAVRLYEDSSFAEPALLQRFVDHLNLSDSSNADAYELTGMLWLKMDDTVRAEREFLKCASLDSGSTASLRVAGYLMQAQHAQCAQDFLCRLAAIRPNDAKIHYYCGLAFSYNSSFQSALRYLRRALQIDARSEEVWNEMAVVFEKMNDRRASDSCYRQSLSINPHNISALNNLAYSYAEQGLRLDEALLFSRETLEADSSNDSYLDTYGWILHKKGDFESATRYFLRATQLAPRSATLFEHLGDNYAKLGKRESAVEAWKRALELDSSRTHLQERLRNSK